MRLHTAAAIVGALFLASCVFGHTVALRLLLLGVGLLLIAIVVLQKTQPLRTLPPIWLPFLLWAAWALLSLLWSIEPGRTWKEWQNEVFYAGAGLWVCFVAGQARYAGRIFVTILGSAALLACAIALYEFSRGWEGYGAGWHGGPGDHSSALVVLMPCAALAGWYSVRTRRPRAIAVAAFGLVALLFASAYTTLNRMTWLAFAAQFMLLSVLMLLRNESSAALSRRARFALAGAVVVAAVASCGAVILSIQTDRHAMGVARTLSHDTRIALWPEVGARIAERPLLGYGFGRGLLRDALQAKFRTVDEHLWHAHNLFLEALIQLGVPGLVLLLYLLAVVAREGWRAARRPDDEAAACGMALLAVVAGMLVRNMSDSLLVRQNALFFWGTVGVLLALSARPWQARS